MEKGAILCRSLLLYVIKKEWIIIKEIKQSEIKKLIDHGYIKPVKRGYVNPKTHQPVGVVKTVHGRHYYIEDWCYDVVKRLR